MPVLLKDKGNSSEGSKKWVDQIHFHFRRTLWLLEENGLNLDRLMRTWDWGSSEALVFILMVNKRRWKQWRWWQRLWREGSWGLQDGPKSQSEHLGECQCQFQGCVRAPDTKHLAIWKLKHMGKKQEGEISLFRYPNYKHFGPLDVLFLSGHLRSVWLFLGCICFPVVSYLEEMKAAGIRVTYLPCKRKKMQLSLGLLE